jgi:hypothetical protein
MYLETIRDIEPGEELSRMYGIEYWIKFMEKTSGQQ